MAMESSFLTSLKMDAKALNRKHRREELLDGTKSGNQILKLHSDLQSLADELDEKVEAKLNANENAFFLAYKSHMNTVQKEFRELKQKADEEETKSRRDKKVSSLEKELGWFMTEALRLDEQCKKYKKELDKPPIGDSGPSGGVAGLVTSASSTGTISVVSASSAATNAVYAEV
mmetsp:Transcript_9962/g.14040  ORF Transcript_9962/g.14040 Transcript_9962/m.14040 type:complete len:174 (-) Transcript_9962:57-578(-)